MLSEKEEDTEIQRIIFISSSKVAFEICILFKRNPFNRIGNQRKKMMILFYLMMSSDKILHRCSSFTNVILSFCFHQYMATVSNPNQCAICKKDTATLRCLGCLQDFCFKHVVEHQQQLNKQLDQIEQDRDLFQQALNQKTTNPLEHSLIQQVDRWEQDSIEKIKQTAQEIRQTLLVYVNEDIISAKEKVDQLTQQLKYSREEDSVTENLLSKWREDLEKLTQQMDKPSNILIQQTGIALVNKIRVLSPGKASSLTDIDRNPTEYSTHMTFESVRIFSRKNHSSPMYCNKYRGCNFTIDTIRQLF